MAFHRFPLRFSLPAVSCCQVIINLIPMTSNRIMYMYYMCIFGAFSRSNISVSAQSASINVSYWPRCVLCKMSARLFWSGGSGNGSVQVNELHWTQHCIYIQNKRHTYTHTSEFYLDINDNMCHYEQYTSIHWRFKMNSPKIFENIEWSLLQVKIRRYFTITLKWFISFYSIASKSQLFWPCKFKH